MDEPLTGVVVAAPDALPAVPDAAPDPRPYVTYMASLKSAESQIAMRGCLDRIAVILGSEDARALPWHALRYEHTSYVRGVIMERNWAPSHRNKHLSALRRVMWQCWTLGLISAEERDRACSIKSDDGTRLPPGRSITPEQVAAMLDACLADENKALGLRDAALITVLYRTGLRRDEAAQARIDQYDPAARSLRVIGKRDKERKVFIPEDALPAVDRWLAVAGSRHGPMFRPVDRWGNIRPEAMSARSVARTVDRRRAESGSQRLSTHDFRRTFGGDFIDAGGDLVQLQKLMGHSSATTTAGYDRRSELSLRDAVDRLKMPGANEEGDAL